LAFDSVWWSSPTWLCPVHRHLSQQGQVVVTPAVALPQQLPPPPWTQPHFLPGVFPSAAAHSGLFASLVSLALASRVHKDPQTPHALAMRRGMAGCPSESLSSDGVLALSLSEVLGSALKLQNNAHCRRYPPGWLLVLNGTRCFWFLAASASKPQSHHRCPCQTLCSLWM